MLRTLWLVVTHDLLELTNRLHVTLLLFRNRLQMTSKCDINTNFGTRAAGGCDTDVFTTFWRLLLSITEQIQYNKESIRFVEWTEKKIAQTFFAPLAIDCSKICASLGLLQVAKATFHLCFFFFLYLICEPFLQKVFQRLHLLKAE